MHTDVAAGLEPRGPLPLWPEGWHRAWRTYRLAAVPINLKADVLLSHPVHDQAPVAHMTWMYS